MGGASRKANIGRREVHFLCIFFLAPSLIKYQGSFSLAGSINHAHTSVNSLFINLSTLKTLREILFSHENTEWYNHLCQLSFRTSTADFWLVFLCPHYTLHSVELAFSNMWYYDSFINRRMFYNDKCTAYDM